MLNDVRPPVRAIPVDTLCESKCDVVVLGCGIAGLTAAYELQRSGLSVVMVDRAEECGGSHRSRNIGPYTFDSGSVFFEPTHPMFDMFDGILETCQPVLRKQGRIAPDGTVRHYPFAASEFLTWPLLLQLRGISSLLTRRLHASGQESAEAFCLSRLGHVIYEYSGLKYYIARFHHAPASEIDILFCEKRMNFILEGTRIPAMARTMWRLLRGRSTLPQRTYPLRVRPRDGFGALYGAIRTQLENKGVSFRLGARVLELARENREFRVKTTHGDIVARNVVGAITLESMCQLALGEATGLEKIDLLTLFISVSQIEGFEGNVLFNFHRLGEWKRLTIYSRIYGKAKEREYFSVEIPLASDGSRDALAAFRNFCRDVAQMGIFSKDLVLHDFDILEDAYPFYRKGCGAKISDAIGRIETFGIIPVGRQGRFAYLPVSALVIESTRAILTEAATRLRKSNVPP
ncbi:NAD(P)/FAD-dependent oxidoreductase [Mangrovicoccus sp. HB161399]|uniref:protoporphyrinogen/coproporphyrinogen oxidase n=1 Tax=Mangrovicoccus sp. HB161399 TaxID=2720392 RepID=UPI0015549D0B|nr:FAD-dependent oxidoreductase [Mangrovicoccus sp. HB161399]